MLSNYGISSRFLYENILTLCSEILPVRGGVDRQRVLRFRMSAVSSRKEQLICICGQRNKNPHKLALSLVGDSYEPGEFETAFVSWDDASPIHEVEKTTCVPQRFLALPG